MGDNSPVSLLAQRYASAGMREIFAPESKIISERKLWIAVMRAQSKLGHKIEDSVTEIATLRAQREAALADAAAPGAALACTAMEQRLKNIVDAAMAPKEVGLDDNLFEVGASSLVLIQIHEEVDRDHPGVVDLTELFDHPTIRALAAHLDSKLG